MERRIFLKRTAGYAAATLTGPQIALIPAAGPARSADLETEAMLIARLFPGPAPERSDRVRIRAPLVTTPGLGFVAKVTADEMNLEAVALMVAAEANPLAYAAKLHHPARYFGATVMIQRTAEVNAYVLSGGRLYFNSLHIKATRGGYGTNSL